MNGKESTSEHDAAVNYFSPRIYEEDLPLKLSEYLNIKYYNIEKIFNLYYQEDSLSIAKESSLSERNNKKLKDSSFVYGEIVIYYIFIFFELYNRHFAQLPILLNTLNQNSVFKREIFSIWALEQGKEFLQLLLYTHFQNVLV